MKLLYFTSLVLNKDKTIEKATQKNEITLIITTLSFEV